MRFSRFVALVAVGTIAAASGSAQNIAARQDSVGYPIADSASRERAPRRIHGVITSAQTGSGIPFAQVFLFLHKPGEVVTAGFPPNPTMQTVANSRGQYVFRDPPLGLSQVIALCKGRALPRGSNRGVLAVSPIWVSAGTDTKFDIVARDISPCWPAVKPHQLESGWFESVEAKNATVPDADERAVFRAAFRRVRSLNPNLRIIGMYTRTMERCSWGELCGADQLPRMVHDRAIDSSTAAEFRSHASERRFFNPGFARGLGLRVFTQQEVQYLSDEAREPFETAAGDSAETFGRFWRSFRRIYGKRSALVSFTRAGFNRLRTEALVEVRTDTAQIEPEIHPSVLMLLRKRNGSWVVENPNVGSGLTSGAWERGACVATSRGRTPSEQEIETIEGVYEVQIIETTGLNAPFRLRMRIGHSLPPRWQPDPVSKRRAILPVPHSFEVIDSTGVADAERTHDFRFDLIPRNVVKDPMMMRLDGLDWALKILSVTEGGFVGNYVFGVYGPSSVGYFCARRLSQH